MFEVIKKFFTDETAFIGFLRAALLGVGALAVSGTLEPYIGPQVGAALTAAGGFVRAGDKNKKD